MCPYTQYPKTPIHTIQCARSTDDKTLNSRSIGRWKCCSQRTPRNDLYPQNFRPFWWWVWRCPECLGGHEHCPPMYSCPVWHYQLPVVYLLAEWNRSCSRKSMNSAVKSCPAEWAIDNKGKYTTTIGHITVGGQSSPSPSHLSIDSE